jgi:hypothetical protein
VVAVEKDVVDCVPIAAVWACGIIAHVCSEASGVSGIEGVASYELESGGLVCARLGGENPVDEWVIPCGFELASKLGTLSQRPFIVYYIGCCS